MGRHKVIRDTVLEVCNRQPRWYRTINEYNCPHLGEWFYDLADQHEPVGLRIDQEVKDYVGYQ